MRSRDRILVTGSAGRVGRLITPSLREAFRLRLLDTAPQDAEGDDEIVEADVRDVSVVARACEGVRAVVHLAAQPAEAEFRDILVPRNVDAAWALFEAVVEAHVPRVVFASSLQVVEGYGPDELVPAAAEPRPVSVYACTKVFGEALARLHSDRSGVCVTCLRIGAVRPSTSDDLHVDSSLHDIWCGSGDLARLVIAAIRSESGFAIVNAVSPPATRRFDPGNPFGWIPRETPRMPQD